jgi:hypothetical protein
MNSLTDWVTVVALLGVTGLAIFQALLAAGLPLGHAAFGGANAVLPMKLRFTSAMSSLVFLSTIYVVLAQGERFGVEGRFAFITIATWILAALFGVSVVANLTSHSRWERYLMAPIALVLAVCFVLLALAS